MRFLINVIESIEKPAHSRQEIDAIDTFNDEMVAAGQRVLAVGIASPDNSILIDNRGGDVKYINESFNDSSEYISGIWIIDVQPDSGYFDPHSVPKDSALSPDQIKENLTENNQRQALKGIVIH